MLPNDAFLRKLPSVVDGAQLVQLEALVFSADAVEASLASIKAVTRHYRERIVDAPHHLRTRLFIDAWTIVDCVHVVRQILIALDSQSPTALSFIDKYESARKLRNKMDHLTNNARNISNAKKQQPIFGALGYVCVRDEDIIVKDGTNVIKGGGTVILTAGRFGGGQSINLVNPADQPIDDIVCAFQLHAFDKKFKLDQAEGDLRDLIFELNDRVEKSIREQAEVISKERGIPLKKILANDIGGLAVFLAFNAGNES